MRYTDVCFFSLSGVLFPREYTTQLNETVKHDNNRESDRHDGRYRYIPSFALPTCTKRHVMLNLTSTVVCNTGTSALYVCNLLSLINMVVDAVVQNPQKSNEYEYEKKHLRRDSKMCCCCCCRFCCGAPTTAKRIHAPVLHDALQIAYCRY